MTGLLCNDTLEQVGHLLFNNFRLAIYNYFNHDFRDINSINDLDGIDKLIIVDEHFLYNKNLWFTQSFVDKVNANNIKVLIFNFEKIFDSHFPWNVDLQNKLGEFNNVHQIVADIDDAVKLDKKFVNVQRLSKSTNFNIDIRQDKIDKILFLGQLNGPQYAARREIIAKLQSSGMEIDILQSDRTLSYNDYLDTINQYKYVLNPLGTGKFINLRFYEALYFNTIPIQQVTEDILKWNPSIVDRCITFTDDTPKELFTPEYDDIYLEDFFDEINLKELI
jgi:hypothetical protein